MKVILTCLFLLFCICLAANPWTMVVLSELWFAENGHLFIELQATNDYYFQNYNQVRIAHGDTLCQLTQDIPITFTPAVIDITEQCPQLTFDPGNDELIVHYSFLGEYMQMDGVRWGYGENDDVRPPLAGQSIVQTHHNYFPHFFMWTYWCKDEPPTPAASSYEPIARDTLSIVVTDQNGQPVPNVPLYLEDANIVCGYTDQNGVFCDTLKAGRLPIQVKHPVTNDTLHAGIIYLEPNHATVYEVVINYTESEDENQPVVCKGLKAYPVPFNASRAGSISFSYNGDVRLGKDSYISLYDTKGRFITQIPVSPKSITNWTPPAELASGRYIARLINGNRFVDTTSFSIIK